MNSDVRLLQLSDPHLFASPDGLLRGVQTLASLQSVLAHASHRRFDAVLCSGDIANDEPDAYVHFERLLSGLGKPVYCVPGNHDDPARLRTALSHAPFQVGGHVDVGAWRLVLLDSCVAGEAGGHLSAQQLQTLDATLRASDRFAMVCVHHHPVRMESQWLDAVGIDNADDFFRVIDAHPQVRAVSWGHVHQCFETRRRGVRLLATPSTCVQFLPLSDDFALDSRPAGYRRTTLLSDGTLESEVIWLESAALGASKLSGAA